jgi:hypothetical protein
VNLTQLPSGTKHCGDTRLPYIFMKFTMIFFQFLKDYCLEKIPPEYRTRKINSWIKGGHWSKWKITMLSGFFGSKENTSFLPYHVSNKMFIMEVAKHYNLWMHFFHEKWKNKFIPLPWKIGDFIFRNINKIDEFENHFHNVNMKYVERIKGFDPNEIFLEHMLAVGFNNSFLHIVLSEEEDNNLGAPAHNVGDLEMVLSTNEFYKQKGKGPSEKSDQSPNVTPKTTTSQRNAPMTHPSRKVMNNSSGGRGEKNLPP